MAPTTEPSATGATRAAGKTPSNDAIKNTSTKSTTNTPGVAPNSTPGSTLGEWRDRLGTGVSRLLAPRPAASAQPTTTGKGQAGQAAQGAAGAGTTPPRPSTGRVMLGMLAFVAGAELLLFLIQYMDFHFFKLYLESHTVASHNTPILGGMTWFLLILMALTLGLWIALNRLHIIQPLTPRPQPQASAVRGRTTQATTAATSATLGRNRAARRAAETRGSAPAKTTSAKAASAKAAASSTVRRTVTGEHDAAYHRVKAAQRSRKRRAAKR